MKHSWILALSLLLTNCGSDEQRSSASNLPTDQIKKPASDLNDVISVIPTEGTLLGIKHKVAPINGQMQKVTEVELGFFIGCLNALGPVSFAAEKGPRGRVDLVVSAYELVSATSLVAFCPEQKVTPSVVTIPGHVPSKKLQIAFTSGAPTPTKQHELVGVSTTSAVEITTVAPLCPAGVTCITNGTVIAFSVKTVGCMDEAAFSYTTKTKDDGKLEVYVSALNLSNRSSRHVRCIRQNEEAKQISLVNEFYGENEINLHILKAAK